jgi:hypothetical protein
MVTLSSMMPSDIINIYFLLSKNMKKNICLILNPILFGKINGYMIPKKGVLSLFTKRRFKIKKEF